MPKSRRKNPPKEGNQQLDIAAINDRLDKRFDQLEEMLEEMLDTQFKEMTKTLADAISGEQQETRREGHDRNSSSQKRRKKSGKQEAEPEQEDVDEESNKKKKEKKEAKASTSNADKEKKKPAAEKHDKEKMSKEVRDPTKEELYVLIRTLRKEAEFTKDSLADICQQLGEEFEEREKEVNQLLDDLANEQHGDKEKASEEVKGPTKEEFYVTISALLKEANFKTDTRADIRRKLGEKLEVDLTDRENEVNQIIHDLLRKQRGGRP